MDRHYLTTKNTTMRRIRDGRVIMDAFSNAGRVNVILTPELIAQLAVKVQRREARNVMPSQERTR